MRTRFTNLLLPAGGDLLARGEFVVQGGRFEAFGSPGELAGSAVDREVSLDGQTVLPGAIDGHVHFDDPGFTWRENFATGTRAAAAGGVTTVVDMPCTSLPPVTTRAALRNKLEIVAPKATVDFMFWGGISGNAMEDARWPEHAADLVEEGVGAFKLYMLSGMETFRDLSPKQMREALSLLARLGVPAGVHAEDRPIVMELTAEKRASGGTSPLDYAASRPARAEVRAVEALIGMTGETGARTHVVHLGSGVALDRIRSASDAGVAISAETCPHYLAFTGADLGRLGAVLKTAPVVKEAEDRDRLWKGLEDGSIQHVATDHAAGEWPGEKSTGSIWTDYGGVPGVELLLPYLLSEGVRKGRITLERLTELISSAPARFFGVARRKGRLRPGFDADFAVVDPDETWTVDAGSLNSLNRYTPFEGWALKGRVKETWVRGRRVFARTLDEPWFDEPGAGHLVRREAGAV
jgi:allantoinase